MPWRTRQHSSGALGVGTVVGVCTGIVLAEPEGTIDDVGDGGWPADAVPLADGIVTLALGDGVGVGVCVACARASLWATHCAARVLSSSAAALAESMPPCRIVMPARTFSW
jgi:hypothetical protein